MNSDMVKPENFDHLDLVYHFTVPLTIMSKKVTLSLQDKQCINDFIFSSVIRIELLLTVVPFLQFERSRKTLCCAAT